MNRILRDLLLRLTALLFLGVSLTASAALPPPPPQAASDTIPSNRAGGNSEGVFGPMATDSSSSAAFVIVYNRPIAILRCKLGELSAQERANRIEARIADLIAQKIYGPVTIEPHQEAVMIKIGDIVVMGIQPCDVDPSFQSDMNKDAAQAVKLLADALEQARMQRSLPFILRASGKVLVATVTFALLVALLMRANRWVRSHMQERLNRTDRWLAGRNLHYFAQPLRALHWVLRLFVLAIVLSMGAQWLTLCLRWFPYSRPWADSLQVNFADLFAGIARGAIHALPNLLIILVILVLTRGMVAMVKGFFAGIEAGRVKVEWMDVEASRATRRIITVVIWLFALVMIYPYIPGSQSAAFKGMSIFVGALVSLGSSSVVGQFTSGLVLMYSQALKPGEYVRIGEHEGTVVSLGFLSTKIRSPKNEEFHVPNAVILGTTIKNYTRLAAKGGLLLYTTVTIGYDVPWRQVHALLINAAKQTQGICPEPEPFVLQTALSDFNVEYQLNACLGKPEDRVRVLAALHANIQDRFNEHGVQIMSPHYMADKAQPVVVPKDQWFKPPATEPKGDSASA